jgi:hypothetical protein
MKTRELPNPVVSYGAQEGVADTVEILRCVFDIRNLSNNELFIIRKITERVLPLHRDSQGIEWQFCLDREIATLFLIEAYGIDPWHITKYEDSDEDREGFFEYIRRVRDRAHLI